MPLNKLFGKYKFITMSVILALLIFCLVFVIIYFYINNDDRKVDSVETGISDALKTESGVLSGDSCFLVVCADDVPGDIVFMFLADFRIYSSKLVITPLSADTVSADGRSYAELYSYGGVNMLRSSIENVRNVTIDRHAIIDRYGISSLTDLMGEISLSVEEDFTYQSSDKSYEVNVGETDMGADMLFTYLKLYCVKHGPEIFASLICDIINTYLDGVEAEEVEKLFAGLTNCFDTDVSISDYYSAQNDIKYIVEHDMQCVLVNDVD